MMSRSVGSNMTEIPHIQQSIQDILTTPLGSRIMRRGYGSHMFRMIDQPFDTVIALQLKAAAVTALLQNEPRIEISKIDLQLISGGSYQIELDVLLKTSNTEASLSVPLAFGATL